MGYRKGRRRVSTHCKLHTVHVNKIPTLCPVLGWVLGPRGASDIVPQISRLLLGRAEGTRIEISSLLSREGAMESQNQHGTGRVSQSREYLRGVLKEG